MGAVQGFLVRLGPDQGGNTMLEARVGRLEGQIDKVDDRLVGVQVALATLNERVAHLPGKGYFVTALLLCLTVFSTLILFEEQILLLIKWVGG